MFGTRWTAVTAVGCLLALVVIGAAHAEQAVENTLVGAQQRVVLTDPYFTTAEYRPWGSEHPIDVTFAQVTASGLTSLGSRNDLAPPPPAGLQAGSPPYYYDIATTAAFTGNIRLCFNIRGM